MEKFNSKKGTLIILGFIFVMLLEVASFLIYGIFNVWLPCVIMTLLVGLLVIPQFFETRYYLDDDDLEINCGWMVMRKSIKYKDIVSVVRKNNTAIAPALCCDRAEIVYMKNGQTKTTYVSPVEIEKFIQIITEKVMSAHGEKPKKERKNEKLERDRNKLADLFKGEKEQAKEKRLQDNSKSIMRVIVDKKEPVAPVKEKKTSTTKKTTFKTSAKKTSEPKSTKVTPVAKTSKPAKKIVAINSAKEQTKTENTKKVSKTTSTKKSK